jgi:dTMP kinase
MSLKDNYPQIITTIPNDLKMFSIEGIDGGGKSTQAKAVVARLIALQYSAVYATNPSDTELGRFLRANLKNLPPWQRVTLFLLDMIDVLKTNSDAKKIIIWDRYIDSTIVSNKELDPKEAARWVESLPLPNLTFFLDIKPENVLANRSDSLHDHSQDIEWQQLKQRRYQELISATPERFVVINAELSIESITEIILEKIISRLKEA